MLGPGMPTTVPSPVDRGELPQGIRLDGRKRRSSAVRLGILGREGNQVQQATIRLVCARCESAIFRLLTPRIPHRHSSRSLRWYSTPSIPRFRHIPNDQPRSVECRAFR